MHINSNHMSHKTRSLIVCIITIIITLIPQKVHGHVLLLFTIVVFKCYTTSN